MANYFLLLLLLFATVAATKLIRAPFNASRIHPAVRASVMSEQALYKGTRRANDQQVQGRHIISVGHRFRCDQKGGFPEEKQMLEHFVMVAHQTQDENQLYFFYREFYVQVNFVHFSRLFGDHRDERLGKGFMLEHNYPFQWQKSFVRDKNNAFYLTTSSSWPEYAPFAKGNIIAVYNGEDSKEDNISSTLIFERPGQKIKFLRIDIDDEHFGYMHDHSTRNSFSGDSLRKPGQYAIVFIGGYKMNGKWLEIIYTTNQTVEFIYWDSRYDKNLKPAIQIQEWEVKQAVYLESFSIDVEDGFEGQMIEVDRSGMMHFHRYTFKIKGLSLTIEHHFHYAMPLLDFFNCEPKAYYPIRRKSQLKGIFIEFPADGVKAKTRTFIFIDLFYFVFDGDLMANRFNLNDPDLRKQAYELQFEAVTVNDTNATMVERFSTKFVKYLPDEYYENEEDFKRVLFKSKPFFTFDRSKTFEISNSSSEEKLIFKKTNRKAHLCSHSILYFRFYDRDTYAQAILCIYKRFYRILSIQGESELGRIVENKEIGFFKRPLASVQGAPAEFEEDIEYVFDYDKEWVVFVTYHWLLAFKRAKVFGLHGNKLLSAFDKQLTMKTEDMNETIFYKKQNCLWTRCDPDHAHLKDNVMEPNDFGKGRSFAVGLNATQARP